MWAVILGSAAGGGFPQWNCWCDNCAGVRDGTVVARTRVQESLAVSGDRRRWYLVNAPAELGGSLRHIAGRDPGTGGSVRRSPVDAVLLTDAELDHAAGLLSLREAPRVTVFATAWVHRAAAPLLDLLAAYSTVDSREVVPGATMSLPGSSLTYLAIATGSGKRPRYAAALPADPAGVVAYRFTDTDSGRSLLYLPVLPALDDVLLAEVADADCALVDGTCWSDDELSRVGLAEKTSRAMGHLPISGPDGSLAALAPLPGIRRVYTHLNNTNPVLVDGSPEHKQVAAAGIEVAYDGLEIEI